MSSRPLHFKLSISFIESWKSKMLAFSSILAAVTDLGMTMTPLWTCHRRSTWAGVLECLVAIALILGSSSNRGSPGWAQGLSGDPKGEKAIKVIAACKELGLPQVRMALHLICHRLHTSLLQQVRDLLRVEARQPDRLGQPLLDQLLHS